ncbi:GIN domain-containing protein [Stenotrophomonas mori]|uniref:DUF2807 domain-containing protein n=1 Tax=Stenotrophomonas mori TaxID=2871096 RepID=A0ABT0SEU6_9GAMM|nr:DUF2807 domain-containing protein [Stenotrophomonas mori]MCL7713608.1 DUF2807 domain-containing protein [Stenotrophomonas mori]
MSINPLVLILAAAFLPATALAEERCLASRPVTLDLDLGGAKAVVFEVNSHDLKLQAAPGAPGALSGRACAAREELLPQLSLSQRKVADKLVVTLERRTPGLNLSLGRDDYAYLDLSGTLPDTLLVQLKVGSGDARLSGAAAMSADVGSGDVSAQAIRGLVTAAVSSGDLDLQDIGPLHLLSLGSGDVKAGSVRGPARVGTVGSGDLELQGVQGPVSVDSIGSGDVDVRDVRGAVTLGRLGSGDLTVRDADSLTVRQVGSGDIRHTGIRGAVAVPRH